MKYRIPYGSPSYVYNYRHGDFKTYLTKKENVFDDSNCMATPESTVGDLPVLFGILYEDMTETQQRIRNMLTSSNEGPYYIFTDKENEGWYLIVPLNHTELISINT